MTSSTHPLKETSSEEWSLRCPNLDLDDKKYQRSKYTREATLGALGDQHDKSWRIFNWLSSILIPITAGAIFELVERIKDKSIQKHQ